MIFYVKPVLVTELMFIMKYQAALFNSDYQAKLAYTCSMENREDPDQLASKETSQRFSKA